MVDVDLTGADRDAVRERLGGAEVEEVRQAVARTVGGLVLWLPREERPALRGALPAPLNVIEQRTVGAELGADAIRAGAISLGIGAAAIFVFIILAYGLFGVFAVAALVVNIFMIMAFMSSTQATMTLPGVAGIILTLAVAVDANVLIYERMRDEQPLYYNEKYDFFALSRFDDVERCSKDWRTYSSAKGTLLELIRSGMQLPPGSIIFEDPPAHDLHRGLLTHIFSPRKISSLEPKVRQFCARSLDHLVGSGGFDFIADLGATVPMWTIGAPAM